MVDCVSVITAGLKWRPLHNASCSLSGLAAPDCQQTCCANTLPMIKMSLTVLSGGMANSASSISLTGMAGTSLLYPIFLNKHVFSSNTNPHRAVREKKIWQLVRKKGSGKMHFPAFSREKIFMYSGLGWEWVWKCLNMSEYTHTRLFEQPDSDIKSMQAPYFSVYA